MNGVEDLETLLSEFPVDWPSLSEYAVYIYDILISWIISLFYVFLVQNQFGIKAFQWCFIILTLFNLLLDFSLLYVYCFISTHLTPGVQVYMHSPPWFCIIICFTKWWLHKSVVIKKSISRLYSVTFPKILICGTEMRAGIINDSLVTRPCWIINM